MIREGEHMALAWKLALSVLAAVCAIYLCAMAWLYGNQRGLIYPAPGGGSSRGSAPEAGSHAVHLTTVDGLDLQAIYRPARSGWPTILFFHGNGDSLAGSQEATRFLAAQGYGLLLPEYRGYGSNSGSPSEEGLYRDARAALQWLAGQGVMPERTIVIGNSLGSGVATEIAAAYRVGALVLVSGFTSLTDVVQAQVPFVPARWLLLDRYDNLRKMPRVSCPILILHGEADTLVPAQHGKALAQAGRNASLETFSGVGHELAYTQVSQARTDAWLRRFIQ